MRGGCEQSRRESVFSDGLQSPPPFLARVVYAHLFFREQELGDISHSRDVIGPTGCLACVSLLRGDAQFRAVQVSSVELQYEQLPAFNSGDSCHEYSPYSKNPIPNPLQRPCDRSRTLPSLVR